jgi:hypothetical protein
MKLSVTWMSSGLPCKVPSSGSPVPADAVGLCDGCPQRLVIIFDNLVVVIRVTVNLIRRGTIEKYLIIVSNERESQDP